MRRRQESLKSTNPKDAVGIAKVPFSTISGLVMAEIGLGMLEGARKYGRHNYRFAGVRASVYFDAALRHLLAWWEGQDIDPASGLSHITKAMAGLMVLRDSMLRGNWTDDRPPAALDPNWIETLNREAAKILERYPVAVPAWTQARATALVRAPRRDSRSSSRSAGKSRSATPRRRRV